MSEVDLYDPINRFFEAQGCEVKGEDAPRSRTAQSTGGTSLHPISLAIDNPHSEAEGVTIESTGTGGERERSGSNGPHRRTG